MRTWTCQRVTHGQKCGQLNPSRFQVCRLCGKRKPPRKRPAHLRALELPYEEYVRINGGERCGICGAEPSGNRRLDRDHDHRTGRPRGLLCHACNRTLSNRITQVWLRRAVAYLERGQTEGMSEKSKRFYREAMNAAAAIDAPELPREF